MVNLKKARNKVCFVVLSEKNVFLLDIVQKWLKSIQKFGETAAKINEFVLYKTFCLIF